MICCLNDIIHGDEIPLLSSFQEIEGHDCELLRSLQSDIQRTEKVSNMKRTASPSRLSGFSNDG